MRRPPRALPLAVVALILTSPRLALACSEPCPEPIRLWSGPWGSPPTIAGNLVFFEVYSAVFDETYAPFALRTAEGEPIAASVRSIEGDLVFAPDAPVPAGTNVVLEYDYGCAGAPHERRTFAFTTTEPTQSPPARPLPMLTRRGFIETPEACDTAFVDLELGHIDWGGLGPLTDLVITVDGEPGFDAQALELAGNPITLESLCDGGDYGLDYWHTSCGSLYRLPPGMHTMEVHSRIVGFPDPEPVRYAFEIQCDPGCGMATVAPEDGAATAPEPGDAEDAPGGPPGDVVSSAGTPAEDDEQGRIQIGGCSVVRRGNGAPMVWLTMLSLPWLVGRRLGARRGPTHAKT